MNMIRHDVGMFTSGDVYMLRSIYVHVGMITCWGAYMRGCLHVDVYIRVGMFICWDIAYVHISYC